MRRRGLLLSCRGTIILLSWLVGSCATVSSNARHKLERRAQANDLLTGGGNIVLTAFRSTALAAVTQPVTTVKIGLANLWHRPREILSGNLPIDLTGSTAVGSPPGSLEFEKQLDDAKFPRAEAGKLHWLVDGPGFFPELDRRIAQARHSIRIQVFIFDNDDIAVRCADTLKRRSSEVPVRVLYDDLGTTFAHTSAPETLGPSGFTPPAEMHDYLEKDSKVRVRRVLDPWLTCDHTKLLVFDNNTAIVGGMNIGREYYSEWHDLMVKVDGPVVASLGRDFDRAWRKAGPEGDLALLHKPGRIHPSQPVAGAIPIRVLRTDPVVNRYEILDATLLAIRGARKRIMIETPYFAHDDIVAACTAAARRGVDVRVIIPKGGDSPIMSAGNVSTARELIQAGAKVYRYPRMNHGKVMICDDWACMGSANLDTLSMRINRELNLAFSDRAAVKALERAVFTPDFRKSKRVTLAETNSASAGLAETIADQL